LPDGGTKPILAGVTLTVNRGDPRHHGPQRVREVDARLLDRRPPEVQITGGEVTLDGHDVLSMTVDERPRAGLFLAMQYPVEVPGVSVATFLRTAKTASTARRQAAYLGHRAEGAMERLGHGPGVRQRNVNEGFSGGRRSVTRSSSSNC